MWKGFWALLLALIAFSYPANSSPQSRGGNVFTVDANIYAANTLIGQPKIYLVAGSETALAVSGDRGYGLRITVDDDVSRPDIQDAVILRSKLYFNDNGRWVLVSAPEMRTTLGAISRQSSPNTTVYGNGGYRIDFQVGRTDQSLVPADFASVEDCPVWKELATDGPLEGVRVRGELVRSASQISDQELPYRCTDGNMSCCSSVHGTCCSDGVTGNRCCT